MLIQPTLDRLSALNLSGLRQALEEQLANPQYAELPFGERVALLVDHEWTRRQHNRLQRRLQDAHLRQPATIEAIDFTAGRGLDRRLVLELAQGDWINRHLNTIVLGPTGAGKTYLVCALARAACQQGFTVRYERLGHLLHQISLSHADGSWVKLLRALARIQLLVLDDWLRDPLTPSQVRDLAELLEDRYGLASTLVASQLPVDAWLGQLAEPLAADGVMDRLVHNAYRLELKGESQRKIRSPLTMSPPASTID